MSFATEVVKDGRGTVYKLDVSLDGFSTIAYRFSTAAGIDAANEYDPRIVSIGRLTRGLGVDHIMQASGFDLTLANDDGGVDWMVDPATAADVFAARARLYVGLYDPADTSDPPTIDWKQLGEFVFDDFPRRNLETVSAVLADDSFGILGATTRLPTVADWLEQDTDPSTNPMWSNYFGILPGNEDRTIPLAWGDEAHAAFIVGISLGNTTFASETWPVIVCVTTSSAAVASEDISLVQLTVNGIPTILPRTSIPLRSTSQVTLWTPRKSEPIAVGGRTFYVVWAELDGLEVRRWLNESPADFVYSGDPLGAVQQIDAVAIKGHPLSARTETTSKRQLAPDVIQDIIEHYSSQGSSANVDTASFARIRLASAAYSEVAGTLGASAILGEIGSPRDAITEIASSTDIDAFIRFDGKVGLSARTTDYASQTAALTEFSGETRVRDFQDEIQSHGRRGAPYNRILLTGATDDLLRIYGAGKASEGPFEDPSGTQETWNRVIPRTLNQSWVARKWQGRNPWQRRNVEAAIRPMASFVTDLEALTLELGDYFTLTYGPYEGVTFQVEELSPDPSTNSVSVTALYVGDLRTSKPYLLDDEDNHRLVDSGGSGGTVDVEDGVLSVTFDVDISGYGVTPGDILVLLDASLPADDFTRYRAIRIDALNGIDGLDLDPAADDDFGSPGGVTHVLEWEIRRGVTNAALLTGGEYPDGALMYGALADTETDGTYSDATAAHKLLEG